MPAPTIRDATARDIDSVLSLWRQSGSAPTVSDTAEALAVPLERSPDALLLAYTVAICADADGPMQTGEILFASVSTTLGALLAILGVIRSR